MRTLLPYETAYTVLVGTVAGVAVGSLFVWLHWNGIMRPDPQSSKTKVSTTVVTKDDIFNRRFLGVPAPEAQVAKIEKIIEPKPESLTNDVSVEPKQPEPTDKQSIATTQNVRHLRYVKREDRDERPKINHTREVHTKEKDIRNKDIVDKDTKEIDNICAKHHLHRVDYLSQGLSYWRCEGRSKEE
jgi:hypothetical protein